jgi:hypothetical protein
MRRRVRKGRTIPGRGGGESGGWAPDSVPVRGGAGGKATGDEQCVAVTEPGVE